MRENMPAAMLREHSDSALGFADNVKGAFELHDRAIHQLDSQLAAPDVEPRPHFRLNIVDGPVEVRREFRRPLGFCLSR